MADFVSATYSVFKLIILFKISGLIACCISQNFSALPLLPLTSSPFGLLIWGSSVQVLVFLWLGSIFRWRQASEACVWTVVVEVGAPLSDQLTGMAHVVDQVLVQTFIPFLLLKLSTNPFCIGLHGAM